MKIEGTDFAVVFVTDFPRAVEFYGETLGLGELRDYGKIPGGEFETGNLTLTVLDAAAVGAQFEPSGHPIAFRVDDVEAARSELARQGVEFLGETMDSGVCLQAVFKDPDGNLLILHRRYAPREP
jgi:catechol 2,3-dioxygenase-like lactoylglutathione lyase family enzyme